ncbi:MAG: MCE family protein [Acidobacteria bacterium]|nr:MCE family protein [Acidobacteriota bacterium]
MPRTRSLAWSELKIGMLAFFAVTMAAVLIFMVGGEGGFFWERYHLKTRFGDVGGLKDGAVVRVAGVEVGTVASVEFTGAAVEVVMELKEDMQSRITSDSRATIGSLSLLGEPVIDIVPMTTGRPLGDWDFIRSGRTTGELRDVAASATEGLQEATRLLQDVRQGKGTVGRLFTDEELYRDVDGFVEAARQVADSLARGRGTAGRLLNDPDAYRNLESSFARFDLMLQRVNAGEGSLGRLLRDESIAKSMASASSNLEALTGKANRGEGTLGRLANDSALYNRLNSVSDQLDRVVARLNQGEGTAGQLLRDKQLYENMNGAVKEVRALIGDIRKDPRRYLSVRVSIF